MPASYDAEHRMYRSAATRAALIGIAIVAACAPASPSHTPAALSPGNEPTASSDRPRNVVASQATAHPHRLRRVAIADSAPMSPALDRDAKAVLRAAIGCLASRDIACAEAHFEPASFV